MRASSPLTIPMLAAMLLALGIVAWLALRQRSWASQEPAGSGLGPHNRLIHEASPYLRQHADNPVDWYPWGEEALQRARAEDRPILLSIGYSSCHWCHVMEHESFEDPAIARIMNDHFVCIKVDREERPDLDHIYMSAVQLMTGQGGWPLNVFLTPELKPFFGGTYFPPEERYGRVGWLQLLQRIAEIYRRERSKLEESAHELMGYLQQLERGSGEGGEPHPRWVSDAARQLRQAFDPDHGGFGRAPKFPQAAALDLLLREHRRTGGQAWLDMATLTLRRMAQGGMYDQLGGGFHRYSVDERWMVPHFEKMLYDNALLPPVYLAAYQLTGEGFFARVARETLDYVLREMTSPEGAFYTATDADSQGEEGVFFVWNPAQMRAALGAADLAEIMMARYGVTEGGNFENGMTVLHLAASPEEITRRRSLPAGRVRELLADGRRRLFEARRQRVPPFRDEKILASWNGLMISALAQAAAVLDEPRYREAAERALAFVEARMREDDVLYHVFKDGVRRRAGELLEDYAFCVQGLLDLFQVTFDRDLLERADALARAALERFQDGERGGFYLAVDAPDLLVRPRSAFDASIPSPTSALVSSLARLDLLLDREEYRDQVSAALRSHAAEMKQSAMGTAHLLRALDFVTAPPREIVIMAPDGDPAAAAWVDRLRARYLPATVLFRCDPDRWPAAERPPILQGREPVDGRATAFVCENFACSLPITEWEALEERLR